MGQVALNKFRAVFSVHRLIRRTQVLLFFDTRLTAHVIDAIVQLWLGLFLIIHENGLEVLHRSLSVLLLLRRHTARWTRADESGVKLWVASILPVLFEHAKVEVAGHIAYSHSAIARVRKKRLLSNLPIS